MYFSYVVKCGQTAHAVVLSTDQLCYIKTVMLAFASGGRTCNFPLGQQCDVVMFFSKRVYCVY